MIVEKNKRKTGKMLESIRDEYENLNPLVRTCSISIFDISLYLNTILTFVGPILTRLSGVLTLKG